jgi:hypothetical protein
MGLIYEMFGLNPAMLAAAGLGIVTACYLGKKWLAGGRLPINLSR